MRRFQTGLPRTVLAAVVLCLLPAVLQWGCTNREEKLRKERERLATEKLARENKGGKLSEEVLDSLRVMKKRFHITRDEYWEGQGGVLSNDFFELWYPPGSVTVSHGMYAFQQLFHARRRFRRFFGRDPADHLTVVCEATMISFDEHTGLKWWVYSKIDDDEIIFQPIDILYQRNLADVAVPRGYHEWGIGKLSGGRAPRWLTQGLASLMADEEWYLENQLAEFPGEDVKMTARQIDSALRKKKDRKAYRFALYNSYRMVRRLVAAHGQEDIAWLITAMGEGEKRDKAFEKVLRRSYDDAVAYALDFKVNR